MVMAIISQSGEHVFTDLAQLSEHYSQLKSNPAEFPAVLAEFQSVREFYSWKNGRIVDCKLTILYYNQQSSSLDKLAEATNVSYIGTKALAYVA